MEGAAVVAVHLYVGDKLLHKGAVGWMTRFRLLKWWQLVAPLAINQLN